MTQQRLEAFERMLADVQESQRQTVARMDALKAQGKEKTVTFRQLMGSKLMYQSLLSMYRSYGLIESE